MDFTRDAITEPTLSYIDHADFLRDLEMVAQAIELNVWRPARLRIAGPTLGSIVSAGSDDLHQRRQN